MLKLSSFKDIMKEVLKDILLSSDLQFHGCLKVI